MAWGLLLLLVGGGLAWLSRFDRMSPLALYVVEIDSLTGIPLFGPVLLVGAALTLRAIFARAGSSAGAPRPAAHTPHPPGRPASAASPPSDGDPPGASPAQTDPEPAARAPLGWQDLVFAQARSLQLESGCRLQMGRPDAPFSLLIERSTVEQARRSIRVVARFLSTAPVPPRLRVTIRGCAPPATPWSHLTEGIFREFFPRSAFKTISQDSGVDVLFNDPDPRWR